MDPGLSGVVPFRFACHRCGHCCSGGSGHVWLEAGEIARMAAHLGCSAATFEQRYVRQALDPRDGTQRPSLREEGDHGGRCALLSGSNTCSVYDARPAHCQTFPYWPRVLSDRAAFESARSTCPGIAVAVEPAVQARAFADLQAFLGRAGDAEPGACCLDAASESTTYATALEADWALAAEIVPAGSCRLGARRPLACRLPPGADGEAALRDLRTIERAHAYPAAYAPLTHLLHARGGIVPRRSVAHSETCS